MDHPEFYKDFDAYKQAFEKFISNSQLNSTLLVGREVDLKNPNGKTIQLDTIPKFNLRIPGQFNLENAALATLACLQLGVDESIVRQTCEAFPGLKRRFEYKGRLSHMMIYEDFAHHPDGVTKTVAAAEEKFAGKKIWVVFQPHLYSRTKALEGDFIKSFQELTVDKIILTSVYAARENDDLGVNIAEMAKKVGKVCIFVEKPSEIVEMVRGNSNNIDILLILGAGDINRIVPELLRNE
jgi:UDP-N-acetylmuramate--alanine ligase